MLTVPVITRPMPEARNLQDRLAAVGFKSVIYPLLQIDFPAPSGIVFPCTKTLHSYSVAIFVSPNAVTAVKHLFLSWPGHIIVGVVGEGSRSRLAYYGLAEPKTSIVGPRCGEAMDSESLLEMLMPLLKERSKILIVRAQTGRQFLVERLQERGHQVDCLVAYNRRLPAMTNSRKYLLEHLIKSESVWHITSTDSLKNLVELAGGSLSSHHLQLVQGKKLFVSHERIKVQAHCSGFLDVENIGSDDDALIARLEKMRAAAQC
jgi:uroporphyrinogen-III synthase